MIPLTQIVTVPGRGKTPLLMEFPIPQDLDGPFIVTSSRDFLLVDEKFPNGTVRAAVRKTSLSDLFSSLVERACRASIEEGWGSCHPATREGLREAARYLLEYGLSDLDILYSPGFETTTLDLDISAFEASWLPEGWAIVVPSERAYLGTSFGFGDGNHAAVLHNASRAMGFLVPEEVLSAGVADSSAGEVGSADS